jgi:uncharacterized protein (DUF1330 family)
MTVYVIVQLKMTDRAAYDRYQARFFDVFRKFSGRMKARRFWKARGIATNWC